MKLSKFGFKDLPIFPGLKIPVEYKINQLIEYSKNGLFLSKNCQLKIVLEIQRALT